VDIYKQNEFMNSDEKDKIIDAFFYQKLESHLGNSARNPFQEGLRAIDSELY
jgi:hypothetical protein